MTKETFGGLLTRWLDHIEARGRAAKTLVENRRTAATMPRNSGRTTSRSQVRSSCSLSSLCADWAVSPRAFRRVLVQMLRHVGPGKSEGMPNLDQIPGDRESHA